MAPVKTSREMSNESIQLPKLQSSRVTRGNNPFSMPKDLELYKAKMIEKQKKNVETEKDVHIGKKGLKSNMEGKLRDFFKDSVMDQDNQENKVDP